MSLEESSIRNLFSASDEEAINFFKTYVQKYNNSKDFSHLDYFTRKALAEYVNMLYARTSINACLAAEVLNLIRLIARDKNHLEVLYENSNVGLFTLSWAFDESKTPLTPDVVPVGLVEALSCLVNATFHSQLMIQQFSEFNQHAVYKRYLDLCDLVVANPIHTCYRTPLIMMIRVLFLLTAQPNKVQDDWCSGEFSKGIFDPIKAYFNPDWVKKPIHKEDGNLFIEFSKFLFNVLSKSSIGDDNEKKLVDIFRMIVSSELGTNFEVVQQMCNLCTVIKVHEDRLFVLSNNLNKSNNSAVLFDGFDMTVVQRAIKLLEQRLDSMDYDLAGVVLTFLLLYCIASSKVRRYTRLQILPPLREVDVTRRPDQGDSMRNKLVRVMINVHRINQLASEFMFVLCKRSVPRMIKYTGFGHSAGLLANSGLLGFINSKQSEENSEDSETEDYAAVEDKINPVTGHLREEVTNPFINMTDEQKEYESMKLVEAMNKLMDAGVIKPGTVGDDGRVRAVSHILELTKDVSEPKDNDSDSD